jgi:hypothetical protein
MRKTSESRRRGAERQQDGEGEKGREPPRRRPLPGGAATAAARPAPGPAPTTDSTLSRVVACFDHLVFIRQRPF